MNGEDISIAKSVSIGEYLSLRGIEPEKGGGRNTAKYSSPFASDSKPSFVFYKASNSFYCFSTGHGGDVISLCMEMEGVNFPKAVEILCKKEYTPYKVKDFVTTRRIVINDFDLSKHTTEDFRHIRLIDRYARSRRISEGYARCVIRSYDEKSDDWTQHPALGFVHVGKDLKSCGVKLRKLDAIGDDRFKARGRQCYYILENLLDQSPSKPILFIVESESSANSLWQFAKEERVNCVIISFGSVTTLPDGLPDKYSKINDIRVIIDYDGSEDLFNERVKMYEKFKGKVIKLILSKGQDINSMYIDGTIKLLRLW